ncbi:VOC family protein [Actinomadura graeca]|nr:VOC family protein [Actinomadura graeca]
MGRTMDFYRGVLGMPLIKTIELPMGWAIYLRNPDGVLVEFAAWTRRPGLPEDVRHEPRTAADRTV